MTGARNDPFSFRGIHFTASGAIVRHVDPSALRVGVLDVESNALHAMQREDDDFIAAFPGRYAPFDYRLVVERADGTATIDDPYRFGPVLGELDAHLLAEGTHWRLWEKLGANRLTMDGVGGIAFAVWAPNARRVSVVGDFNGWDGRRHPMRFRVECGVWELFLPALGDGSRYKFELEDEAGRLLPLKADPVGRAAEVRPQTASIVMAKSEHRWNDAAWLRARAADPVRAPMAIYEVHLGSWQRADGNRFLTYRELAHRLIPYAKGMGFTHLELMPVMEHPYDASWGYQTIGMFAPTSRFGTPDDFRAFVDAAHAAGLGVLLDWVPGHFPTDSHGLIRFDGTALYEYEDPRKGFQPDWNTYIFNFGRREVANYLLANALFWLEEFHVDGLRVDAVASMLYLDYSRKPGEWEPNALGGSENLEAISFLRRLNELVYARAPGAVTIAEESTSFPGVSAPVYTGGLGFGFKWNMGWMHDMLEYFSLDPVLRKHHHDRLTFGIMYAWTENFVLPLSHDEVVYGKGSLLRKMPGDSWQRFANLRALFGLMYAYPGKKLLFMGDEFAQWDEWAHQRALDWPIASEPAHAAISRLVHDLNAVYAGTPALHVLDHDPAGFSWITCDDRDRSVVAFLRDDGTGGQALTVLNATPLVRSNYGIGVPAGTWRIAIDTDLGIYGGSDVGPAPVAGASPLHGYDRSLWLTLPPLATLILTRA